jgi:hypothetical protein
MQPQAEITPQQEQAILALLTSGGIEQAAAACGVSRTTLWRWSTQDQAFQDAYRAARARAFSMGTAALQQLTLTAVKVLKVVMRNSKAAPTARVLAARSVLEFSERRIALEDVESRLSALERAADTSGR